MNAAIEIRSASTKRRRPPLGPVVMSALVCVLATVRTPAQEEAEGRIQTARTALEKWVETRRIISREKRDWALGREMLASWLPTSFSWGLAGAYAFGAIGWLALVLGTLPVLAHRRALLRHREAAT